MGTELTIPRFDEKALAVVDQVADECRTALAQAGNAVSGSLVVAQAMARLRQAVTPQMMSAVHALQGSAVGFKTDKDASGGYTPEQLVDPFLEATVRGFRMIGNEMNIIAGRFYGAKAGFERKVKDFPGLNDWDEAFDLQETVGGNAKVQAIASWTLEGRPDQLARMRQSVNGQAFDNRIVVRVNAGMGYDAVIGKAKRKLYAQVYDYLIGATVATPEGEVEAALDGAGGAAKVRKSSMFDKETAPDSAASASAVDVANEALVEEYRAELLSLGDRKEVPAVARKVRTDARCSDATKAAIFRLCNEATKGALQPAPPTETQQDAIQGTEAHPETSGEPNEAQDAAAMASIEFEDMIRAAADVAALEDIRREVMGDSRMDFPGARKPVLELIDKAEAAMKPKGKRGRQRNLPGAE